MPCERQNTLIASSCIYLFAGLWLYTEIAQNATKLTVSCEQDLLVLPSQFLRRSLEHLRARDELLRGKCGFYLLHLLFDVLAHSPITNEREVLIDHFLRRSAHPVRKLNDVVICNVDERLPVRRIENRRHRPYQIAREENAFAMHQPRFTLHLFAQRLAEAY